MNISNYNENLLLNWVLTNTAVTRPSSWYIGLFSDNTGLIIDQPSNEVLSQDYMRQTVSFATASIGSTSNISAVSFFATTTWSTVSYVGIFDSHTDGNLLFWGSLNQVKYIYPEDQLQFAPNTIKILLN